MKRTDRTFRLSLYAAGLLLAFASASAAAGAGTRPFGVTARAAVQPRSARVGALFAADRREHLRHGHFCTASVVHSPHRNLIVTAAHCLSGKKRELVFVPGYRDGEAPYGVWKVTKRLMSRAWEEHRDEDSDVAFLVLGDQGGKGVEDVVGGNRLATDATTGAMPVTVTVYPNSLDYQVSCTNELRRRGRTQQRIECPGFSGGSSGGPWINGDGAVVGVLGGYENGGDSADASYSAVLGADAAGLYQEARAERG